MINKTPCTDGGAWHNFRPGGLDVIDVGKGDEMWSTRACVWCGQRQIKAYGDNRARWRAEPGGQRTPS